MFYGKFDSGDREFLRESISRFKKIFGEVFAADNVILFARRLGFRRDARFISAVQRNARNEQEHSLLLRLNTLVWAGTQALSVPGDFVECGVWRGFCSAVVADYLDFAKVQKTFYLYDTFEGIPAEYDSEKHDDALFREPGLYESVLDRFSHFQNVRVVRGAVPESFAEFCPERIAFLHLDMNSSKSEIAALEVLFERLSPGAIVVFDDFGWLGYGAQHVAEVAFMRERGHTILELPTGQGLMIRQSY